MIIIIIVIVIIIIKASSSDEWALAVHARRGFFMQHLPLRKFFPVIIWWLAPPAGIKQCMLKSEEHKKQIVRGVHCVTLLIQTEVCIH